MAGNPRPRDEQRYFLLAPDSVAAVDMDLGAVPHLKAWLARCSFAIG